MNASTRDRAVSPDATLGRRRRMLLAGGPLRRLAECAVLWNDCWFEACSVQLVSVAGTRPEDSADRELRHDAIREFVERACAFDIVCCEVTEALALSAECRKAGRSPPPLVVLEVHGLAVAEGLRDTFQKHYGFDPLPELIISETVAWLGASDVQHAGLLHAGVDTSRAYRLDASVFIYEMMLPDADKRLRDASYRDEQLAPDVPHDAVIVPGTGRRDRVTWIQAARLLPDVPFVAIGQSQVEIQAACDELGIEVPTNVQGVHFLPLEAFIAAVRRSRICAVCLYAGTGDGGHTTVCMAQALGVPVIASRVPGVLDYVQQGESARLVPPGDPRALATAIRWLWEDDGVRERLAAGGKAAESSRRAQSEAGVVHMLDALVLAESRRISREP